ncbi:Rieske 2Fe-2S domain-containing protein [Pseudonocardia benzenivorans]|uniref:Rieske 2Fe-2S domain-containing protein n=1 Tax=Pseudonocardia benzenivorans TaxID=228005 RepID=A0ABW3VTA1_9PSEU
MSDTATETSAAARTVEGISALLEDGHVPNFIYNDADVFELEQRKLFGRAWVFLAHHSELPEPGDFVVRYIANDSVIVARGNDGEIRAFLNSCRHRGAKLCNAEMGRARAFTCIYHGWTYDRAGNLTGVPFGRQIYQGLDKAELGLLPVAQVDEIEGFVFGCLDPAAPSLRDYVGDFAPYLQLVTRRSAAGLEVAGPPQRWVVGSDWKISAENFVGDAYHTPYSHHSTYEIGLMGYSSRDTMPGGPKTGFHVQAGNGDMAMARRARENEMGYPEGTFDTFRTQASPEVVRMFDEGVGDGSGSWPTRWHLFPNLSSLNLPVMIDGEIVPFLTIRLWQPKGPGVTEVLSWCLVEADAPEEFKQRSRRAYTASFGPSGMFEQDDMENWRTISRSAKGAHTRDTPQYVRMGEGQEIRPIAGWPVPGTVWPTQYTDIPAKTFLRRWASWLSQ